MLDGVECMRIMKIILLEHSQYYQRTTGINQVNRENLPQYTEN